MAGDDPVEVTSALLRDRPLPEVGRSSSKAERGTVLVVAGTDETPGAALLAGLVDEDPGEQDEHRVGEAAREDDRRDPDEEGDDGDDGAAGEEDRQRREEEGEDVVHGG